MSPKIGIEGANLILALGPKGDQVKGDPIAVAGMNRRLGFPALGQSSGIQNFAPEEHLRNTQRMSPDV